MPVSPAAAATSPDLSLTDYVAGFVVATRPQDVPADVAHLGKRSVLDGIGLALAGAASQTGNITRRYLAALGIATEGGSSMIGSTVIGSDMNVPARFAAFANGISIHADDFDDTQLAVAKDRVYGLLTHPTAPALPGALALAETKSMAGRQLMLAYNIGVEIECKIAEAIAPRHYEDGFHTTGTIGVFGSAASAAKLLGFDRAQVLTTLGIAASEGAGLRENFGTMTKPLHAGRAAESGVTAAELAGLGWTATDTVLEAPRGFFKAAGGGYDSPAILGKLG